MFYNKIGLKRNVVNLMVSIVSLVLGCGLQVVGVGGVEETVTSVLVVDEVTDREGSHRVVRRSPAALFSDQEEDDDDDDDDRQDEALSSCSEEDSDGDNDDVCPTSVLASSSAPLPLRLPSLHEQVDILSVHMCEQVASLHTEVATGKRNVATLMAQVAVLSATQKHHEQIIEQLQAENRLLMASPLATSSPRKRQRTTEDADGGDAIAEGSGGE